MASLTITQGGVVGNLQTAGDFVIKPEASPETRYFSGLCYSKTTISWSPGLHILLLYRKAAALSSGISKLMFGENGIVRPIFALSSGITPSLVLNNLYLTLPI